MKKQELLWTCCCVVCAVIAITWNVSQLLGAEPRARTKDLEFVPDTMVMRALSLGHTNTLAKLRWIDAFSYLQLQFDRRDDTLIGDANEGGFDRLYTTLIDLDPKFQPFYEYAIMSESLLNNRGTLALRCAQRACYELPYSMSMWRNLAAHVKTTKGSNPLTLDGILTRWASLAADDNERYHIERWKSSLGLLDLQGLEQLNYWAEQLMRAKPLTPLAEIAEQTLQQQLNRYVVGILQSICDQHAQPIKDIRRCGDEQLWMKLYGHGATLKIDNAMIVWGPVVFPETVAAQLEQQVKEQVPYTLIKPGPMALRSDPFGYPYTMKEGKVYSIGQERFNLQRRVNSWNVAIHNMVLEKKRWPASLDEAKGWLGKAVDVELTQEARLTWEKQHFVLSFTDADQVVPWRLREMSAYWLSLLNY